MTTTAPSRTRLAAFLLLVFTPAALLTWTAFNLMELGQLRALEAETRAQIDRMAGRAGAARPERDMSAIFVSAASRSLAEAELQRRVIAIVEGFDSNLIETSASDLPQDSDGAVSVRASFDLDNDALLDVLREIEAGTPFMFIDEIVVRRLDAGANDPFTEPVLRVEMRVRSPYRSVVS